MRVSTVGSGGALVLLSLLFIGFKLGFDLAARRNKIQSPVEGSILAQLREAREMFDSKIISQQEFDLKRAQVLGLQEMESLQKAVKSRGAVSLSFECVQCVQCVQCVAFEHGP